MPEPTAALQALRASTADLLKGLDDEHWSDEDLRAPSLCDGWTRGHVLTHLARNADGIAATLSGALRGEIVARYPDGPAGRDADIEAGASRPVVALLADVAESAERLDRVFGAVGEAGAWDAATDGGLAADWSFRRLKEVEVHRVDLAGSYGPDRWPPVLVDGLLPQVATLVPPGVRIEVGPDGSVVPTLAGRSWGADTDSARVITGPDWALAAWLCGRGQAVGSALSDESAESGELPEPAPWS